MTTPHELFAAMSDETRLRCILLLFKTQEICVCEFCHVLASIQPKVSRHLALLRKAGIVLDERKGQWVYYRLNESSEDWARNCLRNISKNLENQEPYLSDFKKFMLYRKTNNCG